MSNVFVKRPTDPIHPMITRPKYVQLQKPTVSSVGNGQPPGRGCPEGAGEGEPLQRKVSSLRQLDRARGMRRADSLAEKLAWVLLRDRRMLGLKFRRQVPIENFIVDFYCHELRLIIELDGGVHDQPSQMKKDTRRNARLRP